MINVTIVLLLCVLFNVINGDLVIDLTEYSLDEFKSELDNYDATVIKFFVPHCPHCRSLINVYISAAVTAHEAELPVKFAEVDCSNEAEGTVICSSYNIKSYPSIKLFKRSTLYREYSGRRDERSLINWLKIYAINRFTEISSVHHLSQLLQANNEQTETIVLGVFKNVQEKAFDKWTKVLKKLSDCPLFSHTKVRTKTINCTHCTHTHSYFHREGVLPFA